MITYTFDKEKYKKVATEYIKKQILFGVIIDICIAALGVFFLLVGLLNDREALNYAGLTFIVCVIITLVLIGIYFAKVKESVECFNNKFPDNIATYTIELQSSDIISITVSCGNKYTIKFNEIEKVMQLKSYYAIIASRTCFFVEKNKDTKEIIDVIMSSK